MVLVRVGGKVTAKMIAANVVIVEAGSKAPVGLTRILAKCTARLEFLEDR